MSPSWSADLEPLEIMNDLLVKFFAPWARLYADHTAVATAVAFVHVGGLLWGGGRAVSADVVTLRAGDRARFVAAGQLDFLRGCHRDVLIGLALTFASGVLQFGSDVEHFVAEPLFWAKLAAVAILIGNGILVRRFEAGVDDRETGERPWAGLRRHAVISLICWFGATLLGQALVNA